MWSWKKFLPNRPAPKPGEPDHDLHYLAAFISAGMSPVSAWDELAHQAQQGDVADLIGLETHHGVALAAAIELITREQSQSWRVVGAAWSLARETGAPLAPALRAIGGAIQDAKRTQREITAALAGPRATLRLVLALPLLALFGGLLTGVNPSSVLLASPLGLGALVMGTLCFVGAWWWIRLLTAQATPRSSFESIPLDLYALALSGGLMPERARGLVEKAMADYRLDEGDTEQIQRLSSLSRRAGVPIALLAREHSRVHRDIARTNAMEKVERLGVSVVLPLGLLVLPGFVLVAVVPMALGLWAGTGLS